MAITVPRPRLITAVEHAAGINVAIATADGNTLTELLRILVPSEPGWVVLEAEAIVQAATAGQQASALVAIAPVGGQALNAIAFRPLLTFGAASGANAEVYGRHAPPMRALLPPNRPGEYMLAATRTTGSNAANVGGTSLAPARLSASRAW
ncbi:MAG TPA: hypothetical protein VGW74_09265 [Propionibacteriaceae bacterium]|nr:hypothetical protein [Propionibacteriaceae bacterium]